MIRSRMKIPVIKGNFSPGLSLTHRWWWKVSKRELFVMGEREAGENQK